MSINDSERGAANPLLIASIILGVIAAGLAAGFAWSFGSYVDQRDNTNAKIETAVTAAKKVQKSTDEKDFLEREKQPYRQLIGPDDLGRVTISYPRTWSVYVAKTGSNGYEAYLNPDTVPSITQTQPYATRVVITEQKYDATLKSFEGLVKKGDLKTAPITVNNFTGVRLDGKFSATRTGSMVLFKVRDKTLIVASDADAFKKDFDEVVVKSLDFNP